jgi:hypothetical protein
MFGDIWYGDISYLSNTIVDTQTLPELKTRPRFGPVSLSLSLDKQVGQTAGDCDARILLLRYKSKVKKSTKSY